MVFNPLFLNAFSTAGSLEAAKTNKFPSPNYLFSDIIKVYFESPDELQPSLINRSVEGASNIDVNSFPTASLELNQLESKEVKQVLQNLFESLAQNLSAKQPTELVKDENILSVKETEIVSGEVILSLLNQISQSTQTSQVQLPSAGIESNSFDDELEKLKKLLTDSNKEDKYSIVFQTDDKVYTLNFQAVKSSKIFGQNSYAKVEDNLDIDGKFPSIPVEKTSILQHEIKAAEFARTNKKSATEVLPFEMDTVSTYELEYSFEDNEKVKIDVSLNTEVTNPEVKTWQQYIKDNAELKNIEHVNDAVNILTAQQQEWHKDKAPNVEQVVAQLQKNSEAPKVKSDTITAEKNQLPDTSLVEEKKIIIEYTNATVEDEIKKIDLPAVKKSDVNQELKTGIQEIIGNSKTGKAAIEDFGTNEKIEIKQPLTTNAKNNTSHKRDTNDKANLPSEANTETKQFSKIFDDSTQKDNNLAKVKVINDRGVQTANKKTVHQLFKFDFEKKNVENFNKINSGIKIELYTQSDSKLKNADSLFNCVKSLSSDEIFEIIKPQLESRLSIANIQTEQKPLESNYLKYVYSNSAFKDKLTINQVKLNATVSEVSLNNQIVKISKQTTDAKIELKQNSISKIKVEETLSKNEIKETEIITPDKSLKLEVKEKVEPKSETKVKSNSSERERTSFKTEVSNEKELGKEIVSKEINGSKTEDKVSNHTELKASKTELTNTQINVDEIELRKVMPELDKEIQKRELKDTAINEIVVKSKTAAIFPSEKINLFSQNIGKTFYSRLKADDEKIINNSFEKTQFVTKHEVEASAKKTEKKSGQNINLKDELFVNVKEIIHQTEKVKELKSNLNTAPEVVHAAPKEAATAEFENSQKTTTTASNEQPDEKILLETNAKSSGNELNNSENKFTALQHDEIIKVNGTQEKTTFSTHLNETVKFIKAAEVVKEITNFIKQGDKTSMTFKLTPEHLGEVKVMLDITKNIVNANFEVESESVRQVVQNNIDALKQSLIQSGVIVAAVNINLAGHDQKSSRTFEHKKKFNAGEGNSNIDKKKGTNKGLRRMGYNTYEFLA